MVIIVGFEDEGKGERSRGLSRVRGEGSAFRTEAISTN